jgi:hypothetical protein
MYVHVIIHGPTCAYTTRAGKSKAWTCRQMSFRVEEELIN